MMVDRRLRVRGAGADGGVSEQIRQQRPQNIHMEKSNISVTFHQDILLVESSKGLSS